MAFGILDAVSQIASNMFADERQDDAQNFMDDQRARTQHFNSAEAAAQRDWSERMSSTSFQRGVADLRAAGLNPALAYSHGAPPYAGASASGSSGGAGIATPANGTNLQHAAQSASQVAVNEALADKTAAEADEVRLRSKIWEPTTREIEARIPKHEAEVDNIRQQIAESGVRIEKIWEEANVAKHSAINIQQQTANLRETIPQIRAQVQHLKALAAKESAETDHIKQLVKANLPEMERTLMNLERIQREMAQPGHANEERAADSFVGQLGAYMRQLGRLPGIFLNRSTRGNTTIHNHGGR